MSRNPAYIQFALATPVVLWAGARFFRSAWASLRHGGAEMNTLISLGTGVAYLYFVAATFAPAHHPQEMPAVYFEAASVIITLVLLGRILEAGAKRKTGDALRRLSELQDGWPTRSPVSSFRSYLVSRS